MRMVCPACAAAYEVPDGRVSPGMTVRCARCGTEWVPEPPVADAAAEVEPVAEVEPQLPAAVEEAAFEEAGSEFHEPMAVAAAEKPVAARPPARSRFNALAIAWAASVLIVLGAVVAGGLAREGVMRAWPPSVRLYAAFGLARGH